MAPTSAKPGIKSRVTPVWRALGTPRVSYAAMAAVAALALAPLAVHLPARVLAPMLAALAALWIALCLVGLASRVAYVLGIALLDVATLVRLHVGRHWGGDFLDSRFEAILESPPAEVREYLASHVDGIDVLMIAGVLGLIVLAIVVAARFRPPPWRIRAVAALVLVAGVGAVFASGAGPRLKTLSPFKPFVHFAMAKERYDALRRRSDYLTDHPLQRAGCRAGYDKIVIVIGESALSDRMGVFGYERATTPFASGSGVHAFAAIAPSNQTRVSLGMMFTDAVPGDFERFFSSHSLVGLLGACGYRTTWISNQGRRGKADSFSTSLAEEADEQVYLNAWTWTSSALDGEIIKVVDQRGQLARPRQATFIHLIGSHSRYSERYPEGFGFPDAKDVEGHYDNSILYTDFVLSELHRRLGAGRTLLIYVSDHGQIVSNERWGSGFLPGFQEEFRTPLLIWTDDEQSMEAMRAALGNARFNLASFDDVVRYLVGNTTSLNASTSSTVTVTSPEIVRDYRQLATLPGQ
jgi:glucan phosphoethanolaminetransferase (alkaline phosphatase superfamily)